MQNRVSDLSEFERVSLVGVETPVQHLERLSLILGRDIYIKRDDLTWLGGGGNKLRKLEFLAADALKNGCDTLLTAGAIQSNHVRQTAAVAARLGLKCVALLENPIGTASQDYLRNGNHLLFELMGCQTEEIAALDMPDAQLEEKAAKLREQGLKPYVVPVGGSNALGSLGYVDCAYEIKRQSDSLGIEFSAVVVTSGSAGTHAGLAIGMSQCMPDVELVGITVSRTVADQEPKVNKLQKELGSLLHTDGNLNVVLWDEFFAPMYGMPNECGMDAVKLLAESEGILLDPVYTGKTMAGLIDGVKNKRFRKEGPVLFIHTGGAPALFAYAQEVNTLR